MASKKPARSYSYNRTTGTLHIRSGKLETGYFLDRAGDGWELTKLLDRGTVYTVRAGACNCKGFRSHSRCKHRDALAHMQASGRV